MPDIALYVNGLKWLGWQEATVTRSIDAVFNQYTLRLTSTWPGAPGAGIPPVKKGDECSLALEGETVVTGFLNNVRLKVTADGFDLTVDGRDKTALLFKGAVLNTPAEWSGKTALQIAQEICEPFGITVRALSSVGAVFKKFTCQPGETANRAIQRLCGHRALFHYADPAGNLILANADAATPAARGLALGFDGKTNVESVTFDDGLDGQYSDYVVYNQKPGLSFGGNPHNKVLGRAKDHTVRQYCPKVVIANEPGDTTAARDLAVQTAALAAARALALSYETPDWRPVPGGKLWSINTTTPVTDDITGVKKTMLIKKAVFHVSEEVAETSTLTVVDPKSYALIAEPEDNVGGWS
ncbi:MAG: hypothetical protein CMM61_08140 [Rhodospirillaceae bacterium]|nr:hypothetical protein [Rhodospirillaceae bacterium]